MRIVVTGGSGFLGAQVAKAVLRAGRLRDASGTLCEVTAVTIADLRAPTDPWMRDPRVRIVTGDLADAAFVASLLEEGCDSLFHFAAILKADADRDRSAAVRFNVLGLVSILERIRALGTHPKFFFASSSGVFENGIDTVSELTRHRPTSTYGAHKAIGELLVDDYSRTGAIDGRGLRFPIVMVRPNRADRTVSNAISAIVREPLQGVDIEIPYEPGLRMPVTSVETAAHSTLLMHDLPADRFTGSRTANLPALSVTLAEIADAVQRRNPLGKRGTIRWRPDPAAMRVFLGRPESIPGEWCTAQGIAADRSIDAIIDAFAAGTGWLKPRDEHP